MLFQRGEIWLADLNPTRGHEQSGIRPALIISVNPFNQGGAELIVVLPITSKDKKIPLHVKIEPQVSNLDTISYIKCEDIRSISKERIIERIGQVPYNILEEVEQRLKLLLGI